MLWALPTEHLEGVGLAQVRVADLRARVRDGLVAPVGELGELGLVGIRYSAVARTIFSQQHRAHLFALPVRIPAFGNQSIATNLRSLPSAQRSMGCYCSACAEHRAVACVPRRDAPAANVTSCGLRCAPLRCAVLHAAAAATCYHYGTGPRLPPVRHWVRRAHLVHAAVGRLVEERLAGQEQHLCEYSEYPTAPRDCAHAIATKHTRAQAHTRTHSPTLAGARAHARTRT